MGNELFLPSDYVARQTPQFDDHDELARKELVWQADVYLLATCFASALEVSRVIDIGCGHAEKTSKFFPGADLVGVDTPENVSWCRAHYATGTWLEANLEHGLPDLREQAAGALLICADIIEHLVDPMPCLRDLSTLAAQGARGLIVSTPDRELLHGSDHRGPPRNQCHVREWSLREFGQLLDAVGLVPTIIGHVAEANRSRLRRSIFAFVTALNPYQRLG